MGINKIAGCLVVASAIALVGTSAHAQTQPPVPPAPAAPAASPEIAASHLEAARKAVASVGATDQFDGILPSAAAALKAELIRKNPDMNDVIISTVDEETLALVSRRSALEQEVARVYARIFSEAELNEMAAFYSSSTGKKVLEEGPIVGREVLAAADIWQRGVARDLAQAVGEKLKIVYDARQGSAAVGAPIVPAPTGGATTNQ